MNELYITTEENTEFPFYIEFQWKHIKSRITLENGEDLIKLSMVLSEFFTNNGIPNKLDITSKIS